MPKDLLSTVSPFHALPNELHLSIITFLASAARYMLRLTSSHLRNLISPLTSRNLLETERSMITGRLDILPCNCCCLLPRIRFEPRDCFEPEMVRRDIMSRKFCITCRTRPLIGDLEENDFNFHYLYMKRWKVDGVSWGRCARCGDEEDGVWLSKWRNRGSVANLFWLRVS